MTNQTKSFWFGPKGAVIVGVLGALAYYLLTAHRQHVFEALPLLILLLCPLMHIFMHGGHGHGHGDGNDERDEPRRGHEGRRQAGRHDHDHDSHGH